MHILAFLVFAFFPGTGPASAWREYVYLDQGVAIQFPAKPQAMKSRGRLRDRDKPPLS